MHDVMHDEPTHHGVTLGPLAFVATWTELECRLDVSKAYVAWVTQRTAATTPTAAWAAAVALFWGQDATQEASAWAN